jgi:hypothetical protein
MRLVDHDILGGLDACTLGEIQALSVGGLIEAHGLVVHDKKLSCLPNLESI